MKRHGPLLLLLFVSSSTCVYIENEAPHRFSRAVGDTFEVVTAQAAWSDERNNYEDSWYFMEDRISNYNDTLLGYVDRSYLRNALDNFQAKLSGDVQFLRNEGLTNVDATAATAAIGYASLLEGGLRCSSNGALDALDTYTCDVMTDASDPLDDVLFSLLKGDQHVHLAVADVVLQMCEFSLAVEEWNSTLDWVHESNLVNAAHEYVLDMARRAGALLSMHMNDLAGGCDLWTKAITEADTDRANLSPAERALSDPIYGQLQSDITTNC